MNLNCAIECKAWLAEQLPALGRAMRSGTLPQVFHIVQMIHLHALKSQDWSPGCAAAMTDLIVALRDEGALAARDEAEIAAILVTMINAGAQVAQRHDLVTPAPWHGTARALVPVLCEAKEMFGGRPSHTDIADAVHRVLTESGSSQDVNETIETGQHPIHLAVRRVNGPLVKVLLAHGADPYAVDPATGKNAFRLAEILSIAQLSQPLEAWRASQPIGHIVNRVYGRQD